MVVPCAPGCSKRALEPNGQGTIVQGGGGAAGAAGDGGGGADGRDAGEDLLSPRALGQPCARSAECGSGFCAGSVCCNATCAEACKRCDLPGSLGVCVNLAAGAPPRWASACPATAASTCGLDGTCNGEGTCRFHPLGTICAPGTCGGGAVFGPKGCDGRGACQEVSAVICVPYTCDPATAACRESCVTDTDCYGTYCEPNGRCHLGGKPTACTLNAQCASGFCADGYCCGTACNDDCQSCDVLGHEGTCWPRPDLCPGADAGSG
jgi:hypothetical protein